MNEKNAYGEERLSSKRLHVRILVLEVVTFLSLVLNLALWYFVGNVNSKVNNEVANPSNVQMQR